MGKKRAAPRRQSVAVEPRPESPPRRPGPPPKAKNADRRDREYLTPDEVEALRKAASKVGRHGLRDSTMILMAFRHGLRACEVCSLLVSSLLDGKRVHIRRAKRGVDSNHPLNTEELRALGRLARDRDSQVGGAERFIFVNERGGPLTEGAFRKIVARAGVLAGLQFPVHPHMLRHACGYKLANDGTDTRTIQDYLGHRNIQHTVRYTALSDKRFVGIWKD